MIDITKLSLIVNGTLPYQNITIPNATILIGRSLYGPSLIPIEATSKEQVARIFGEYSELTLAYMEAKQAGINSVYLIKLNGGPATASITGQSQGESSPSEKIKLLSIDHTDYCNFYWYSIAENYNDGKRYLYIFESRDTRPKRLLGQYCLDGKTIGSLANEINRDAFSGSLPVYAEFKEELENESTDIILSVEKVRFSGGLRQSTPDPATVYDRLEYILNMLQYSDIKQIGILYSLFYQFAPSRGYIYKLLSNFTREREKIGRPCFINLGVETYIPLSYIKSVLSKFSSRGFPTTITINDETKELLPEFAFSEYINILVSRTDITLETGYTFTSNNVSTLCSLIDSLSVNETLTNKKIGWVTENKFNFSTDEVKELTQMGYMVVIGAEPYEVKIYKDVNLLYYTEGIYYTVEYDEELGQYVSVQHQKPKLLGRTSNVFVIINIMNEITSKLDKDFDLYLKSHPNFAKKEILYIVRQVLDRYSDALRYYNYTVEEIFDNKVRDYSVLIDIIPYGEFENVSFSVTV